MDPIKLGQVTNADVYMDGAQIIGRIDEFKIEGVGYKEVKHEALGMIANVELPGRTLEPMKAKIKFAWLDEAVMRKTALPNRVVNFQTQQYVDIFDSDGLVIEQGHRLITSLGVLFRQSDLDAIKNGEKAGDDLECSVVRLRVTTSRSSVPIREISVFDNINRADGKDVWPTY